MAESERGIADLLPGKAATWRKTSQRNLLGHQPPTWYLQGYPQQQTWYFGRQKEIAHGKDNYSSRGKGKQTTRALHACFAQEPDTRPLWESSTTWTWARCARAPAKRRRSEIDLERLGQRKMASREQVHTEGAGPSVWAEALSQRGRLSARRLSPCRVALARGHAIYPKLAT